MPENNTVNWFDVSRESKKNLFLRWSIALFVALFLNWFYISGLPVADGVELRTEPTAEEEEEAFFIEMADEIPEMKYVETNPDNLENEPDETPNISNRDQQAAQEDVAGPVNNDTPFLDGEDEESPKIVEGAIPVDGEDAPQVETYSLDSESSNQPQPAQQARQARQASRQQEANQAQDPQQTQRKQSQSQQQVVDNQDEQQASPEMLPTMEVPSKLDELPAIPPPPPTPDFIEEVESVDPSGLKVPIIEAPEELPDQFSSQPGEDSTLNINIPPSVAQQISKAQEERRKQLQQQLQEEQQEHSQQQNTPDQSAQEAQQAVKPQPLPRPRLSPKVLPGPTLQSQVYAARMGAIGYDAKFSQFGYYLQRMFETIQLQWYSLLDDVTIGQEKRPAYVVIEFDLDSQGKVVETRVIQSNAGQLGTYLCQDAIESRAPFGTWTLQMIDQLGDQTTITLKFIYL